MGTPRFCRPKPIRRKRGRHAKVDRHRVVRNFALRAVLVEWRIGEGIENHESRGKHDESSRLAEDVGNGGGSLGDERADPIDGRCGRDIAGVGVGVIPADDSGALRGRRVRGRRRTSRDRGRCLSSEAERQRVPGRGPHVPWRHGHGSPACPLFMPVTDGVNFLPGGFGQEVIDAAQGPGTPPARLGHTTSRRSNACTTRWRASRARTFTFHTNLIGVETAGQARGARDLFRAERAVRRAREGLHRRHRQRRSGRLGRRGVRKGRRSRAGSCPAPCAACGATSTGRHGANSSQAQGAPARRAYAGKGLRRWRVLRARRASHGHVPAGRVGWAAGNIGHTFDVDATDEVSLTNALV